MKKRLSALALAAALLLSSCNNQTEQTTTTTQATTAVTTTAQTTTTPKVTTTAKTTASTTTEATAPPVENYKKDWIKPTLLDEQIICTAEKRVDEEKLFYELWESFDFDFTKCGEMYEMAKGYDVSDFENYPVEKNTALGHQHLNQWLDFYYIGTDEADWICVANYVAEGFSPGGVYTRIVLVKDNEIVREVCETGMNLAHLRFLHGDIFVSDYGGLYMLNLETGELKNIYNSFYNSLLCADEKYIAFSGMRSEDWREVVVVYNRETEALTETDIVIYDSYIGVSSRINGDTIEYFDFSDNKAKICDIETGEIRVDESLDFHEELENDEYIFSSVEYPEAGDSYANGVKITRKSDGETKIFDINLPLYSEPVMRGDWCVFIGGYPDYLLAVNFKAEEICKGEYEGVYNISYNPLSDKFYVDDNDKTYTIELKFPAEKIKPAVLEEKIGYTTEHVVDKAKIEKELWENLEFDLTKDESYEYIREFDEHHTEGIEKNRELGHQFLMQNLYFYYIGREEGDWLCLANYRAPSVIGGFTAYTNLALIKDNKVVKEIHLENEIRGTYFSEGEVFVVTSFELLKLDLKSGTSTPIMYDNLGSICHIDENLIIYGSSNIQIYNRKTGEITETGIDYHTYACPDYEIRLNGNRLEYEAFENEKGMVYDLETGEIYEDESLEFYDYAENDKYIVFQRDRVDYKTLTITRKSDGLSKEFDITEISPDGKGLIFNGMFVEFWEDWCFISSLDWYAVNFETEEIAACDFISHYSFLSYNSEGDCLYSNTDELTAVIKPALPH